MSDPRLRYPAIVFDMGDVLFDATRWRRWLTEHLRASGVRIDYPALCHRWDAALVAVYLGRTGYWQALGEFLAELGLDAPAAAQTLAAARRKAGEAEQRTLFDGVAETLEELQRMGAKLAVLSDTESRERRVRERLADLGIERYFDAVVTSIDIGYVKPQPEAYAAVLDRLAVPAESALFVGHDEDELCGAADAGLTTVAYNVQGDVPARHHIRHFAELTDIARDAG